MKKTLTVLGILSSLVLVLWLALAVNSAMAAPRDPLAGISEIAGE